MVTRLFLRQDGVGVLRHEGAAQRSRVVPVPAPLHPHQPALPPVALRGPTEAGAAAEEATVSCVHSHRCVDKCCTRH